MSVAVDERTEGHHEIHVLVAVRVPDMRTAAALQKHRAGGVCGLPARGRIYSLDQRLLSPLKPLLGAGFDRELR